MAVVSSTENASLSVSRCCRYHIQSAAFCLDTVTRDHPQAGVVVLGDFNRLRDAAIISYPLKQVVKAPTRRAAVLDKIYTNMHDWYDVPVVLPNTGQSDHRAVVMSASVNVKRERGQDVTVLRRSQDSNGKAKLAQALKNYNYIIKSICKAQDPLKKAANALSGS